ncbi:asparaginase [Alcaligenaceae bacterium CGII-47]|nr:asparaginase [Alcaligenaceae bacterium CGII-47]
MHPPSPQARIVLLGTGGTIAATAGRASALTDYSVTEDITAMLDAVPGAHELADIQCEQVFNVDSSELTGAMVLRLARRIEALTRDPMVDGIVVTHGTDTLEETAFLLHLTIHSPKAIVLVGAMRPASALSADGPLNLYNALSLAAHPDSRGCGILLMMNDQILAARYATKSHTTRVDAFNAIGPGALGWISQGVPHIVQGLTHATLPAFTLKGMSKAPRVDIIYDHQGAGAHLYEASIAAGARGIVIAGTGNGSLSPGAHKGGALARRKGLMCVRSSRVPYGEVGARDTDARTGLICSHGLNPQQSRILLMLALANDLDQAAIQARFKAC